MKKILFVLLILAGSCFAADSNTDNSDGVGYGSAAARDTAYASWDSKEYIDTYYFRQISMIFKITTSLADTIIFNVLGSNQDPDSLRYYYVITSDTLLASEYYDGDSCFVVNLPYGTTSRTSILPRYLKYEFEIADTASSVSATATIGDSWIAR